MKNKQKKTNVETSATNGSFFLAASCTIQKLFFPADCLRSEICLQPELCSFSMSSVAFEKLMRLPNEKVISRICVKTSVTYIALLRKSNRGTFSFVMNGHHSMILASFSLT